MKNDFEGLISRLDMAKERISEVEDVKKIETLQLKSKQNNNKRTKYSRTLGQPQKV